MNVSLLGMNTCDPVTEENSPLSLSLIRTLLTIGGVELNPGPPMMTEKSLMAELVLGAEEQSSKDILIKIESVHDQKATRNVLNTANTEQLRHLAKYILAWDEETSKMAKNYKKEGLITLIYNCLKILMPEDCKSCGIRYWFTPSDYTKSGLNCLKCYVRCAKIASLMNHIGHIHLAL